MLKCIILFLLILKLKYILTFDDSNDDIVALNIEDNILDGKYLSFTKVNIRLTRQLNIELTPSRSLSSSHYERLIEESRLNPQLYYTLKVHFKRRSVQDYVMTSIPMCHVLQSQLQYPINLFINENGYIVSVNILTNNSRCCLSNITIPEKHNDIAYKVRLRLHFNDLGPQPEIQHFMEKIKREKEAKMNNQENDNRPFVLKYWKYILPVVVILVLQSAFTDPGATGGGR